MKLAQFIQAEKEHLLEDWEEAALEIALQASLDSVAIFDPGGRHLFLNKAMAGLVNATHRDIVGKTPLDLGLGSAAELHEAINTTVTTGQTQRRELCHWLPSGPVSYFDCQFVPVFNDRDDVEAVVKSSRDITERKQAEYQVLFIDLDRFKQANDQIGHEPGDRLLAQVGFDESHITVELAPASLNNIRASGFNPVESFSLAGCGSQDI